MTNLERLARSHLVLALLAVFATCAAPPVPNDTADLVLLHGKVVTVDDRFGDVEALAVRGDRILAVGSDAEIEPLIGGSTRVIDLAGRTVVPGFIEGHGHFLGLGDAKQNLDLMGVRNWDEVVEIVADAVQRAQPGEWIVGRGWHQEKWDRKPEGDVEGFPSHHSVSAVSPDNPVALTHASGHASFFNQKAMDLAGIDAETADPPGGEILREENGDPCGVFRETASALVHSVRSSGLTRRSPAQVDAALRRAAQVADQECLSKGVTSFQDAGTSFREIDVLRDLAADGALRTRLYVMIRDSNARLAQYLERYRLVGAGDNYLTVRAIKRTLDGALGARGAWLLEPYSDSPESTGLNTATIESVTETARLAALHDFQFCVHAIGDRANREVLDLFEATFAAHPEMRDPRWRIEHAQHLSLQDIPRFGKLGVIASMQGVHCTSDAPWVTPRLGAQRAEEGAYVWQKLLQSGALVTNGTDAPVEDVDPIASFYATVTRRTADGTAFYPEQCMSREEALKSYTIWAAQAAFEEELKGSLSPGKLADLVVLDQDIMTVPDEDLLDTEVLYTIVGGKVEYEAEMR